MKKLLSAIFGLFLLVSCASTGTDKGQTITVTHEPEKGYVDLTKATVVFDKSDWDVVKNTAQLFVSDVNLTTGKTIAEHPACTRRNSFNRYNREKPMDRPIGHK